MPIYEYRCAACGHKTEALQKLSDPPLTTCPACGKPELAKLVSAAGFQLKGSGWYVTDFRGGASKPADKPEGADAKSSAETPAAADSKPAEAKTPAKSEAAPAAAPASAPASGTPASGGSSGGS
jgi:putative FmdB family regulatory protein